MHTLIVYVHPEPCSFNATLKEVAVDTLRRQGHTVEVSDLYAEDFDPVEGPAHYKNRTAPDSFSALAEQRHASQESGAVGAVAVSGVGRLGRERPVEDGLKGWRCDLS